MNLTGLHTLIYLRKSRADLESEARGEGDTLARHRTLLLDYANRTGLAVGAVYEEVVSGDTIQRGRKCSGCFSKWKPDYGRRFWWWRCPALHAGTLPIRGLSQKHSNIPAH